MKDILFPTFSFYPNLAMDLGLPTNFNGQYSKLTKWEKIFALNFYKQEGLQRPTDKETKYDQIRSDINTELERLYAIEEDFNYFIIDIDDNPYLDRKYEANIKALEARGENFDADHIKSYPKEAKREIADRITLIQRDAYINLIKLMEKAGYEPAFKALMLRETLMMVYTKNELGNIFAQKREKHKTLAEHLVFNKEILDVIYNEIQDFSRFSDVYFKALDMFTQSLTNSAVQIVGINTFGKGTWIKFNGKSTKPRAFLENSNMLSALAQGTPWCTKDLASYHLKGGDFYVFVDNGKKPHIAVRMERNKIGEVRGISGGRKQEIEDDYRDVVTEFLTKYKDIVGGKDWLTMEKLRQKLMAWEKKVLTKTLKVEEVGHMFHDIYALGSSKNSVRLEPIIFSISMGLNGLEKVIADYYNVPEDKIISYKRLFNVSDADKYVVILDNVYFHACGITNLTNLKMISANASFYGSSIKDLGSLEIIGGNANFEKSEVENFGALKEIGGKVNFSKDAHGRKLMKKFKQEFYYDEESGKTIRRPEYLKQNSNQAPLKKDEQFE